MEYFSCSSSFGGHQWNPILDGIDLLGKYNKCFMGLRLGALVMLMIMVIMLKNTWG